MKPALKIINECKGHGLVFCLKDRGLTISGKGSTNTTKIAPLLHWIKEHSEAVKDQIAELEARAATLEDEGGLSRSQAESQAFEELAAVGNSPQATRGKKTAPVDQIRQWRGLIQSLPSSNSSDGAKLVKYALTFLDSPLSLEAVSNGWDALSLFGVFNEKIQTAQRRHDAMGLIPSLAWSKISGNLSGIKARLQAFDGEQAYIEFKAINDKTGTELRKKQILSSPEQSVIFWENAYFIGGNT